MSIEWLLAKTQNPEFQTRERGSQRPRRKTDPSNRSSDLPPEESVEEALGHEGGCQPANEQAAAHEADRLREAHLRCECGYEGTLSSRRADFKMSADQKSGVVRFECPKCGRHQQYDPLTGMVKTRKGIWGFLLGRFS
jgi:hypothetical protein